MEKYENLGVIGEGSYGVVLRCKHKETGQVVAIKKFLETEDDPGVKKIALREVRMLKRLRHEHLINLIEVFRRRRKLYLVFEYVDHTILEELEEHPSGLDEETARRHVFQVLRAIQFCHQNSIIHRDVKPENILVSKLGIVKLCDFGFARMMAGQGEAYTDYVATRWYRAPELLVGDPAYGKEVDLWAIGCLYAEMLSGDPLFPGDSDIDQLFHIVKCLGSLCTRHRDLIAKNPMYSGINISNNEAGGLHSAFPTWSHHSLKFVSACLAVDPNSRPSTTELLQHALFTHDSFSTRFMPELKSLLQEEFGANPLLKKKKQMFAANRQRSGVVPTEEKNWKNLQKNESSQQGKTKGPGSTTIRRPSDNEGLFDEVMKKSLVYSQKYTPGKQAQNSSGKDEVGRRDASARSLISITPGGTIELDSFREDEDKNKELKSPERMSHKNMVVDLNSRNPGLKRFEGFEQGLNTFHVGPSKGVLNQRNGENVRKSPPSKKTKKTNLDFPTDSPSYREPTVEKSSSGGGDPVADKFTFLERAFDRAFHFEAESGPKSLTPGLNKDIGRNSGRQMRAAGAGRLGGGGPHGTNDDFWLPKVSGATGQGRKGGPQQFHSVIEGVSSQLDAREGSRRNLPHV